MDMTENQRVLVTGGAGFIGSHLLQGLAESGFAVEALDNLSTGNRANLPPRLPFHEIDVRAPTQVRDLIADGGFTAVIHCAAQTSVERSMNDPETDREINVEGTRALLDAAGAAGVRRLVYLSSGGAIYGESPKPADENSPPAPRSHYASHKLAAERLLAQQPVPYTILRPSNVYGLRQRSDAEGGVVAIFLERLLSGRPLVIHGAGRQVRDFLHVSDVVSAVKVALDTPGSHVWNVCSGVPTSIIEMAHRLAAISGRSLSLEFRSRRAGDIENSVLNPAALLATGRWGPPLPLDEGLRLLISDSNATSGVEVAARRPAP
ncbi:MAG: NAD-dependent epimerase/dehydratase family protein [Chloroflexi bacterium]|nr:MAG: NAD-dependent epimerase/dehydratase family protein [Chloroflexota bacterium]